MLNLKSNLLFSLMTYAIRLEDTGITLPTINLHLFPLMFMIRKIPWGNDISSKNFCSQLYGRLFAISTDQSENDEKQNLADWLR